ncbi:MAG: DUF1573 domain-containing protein [Bacteroidota bacterium]
MKKISSTIFIAFSMLLMLSSQSLFAQTADQVNVKKELKSVLKEMPEEMQMEVLRYATRKRDAYVAMEAKKAEAAARAEEARQKSAAAAEQPQATPQPKPAAEVQLAPQSSGVAAQPAKPAAPAQPAYIQQAKEMAPTSVEWFETQHDFGSITQGETVSHTFRFKNNGTEPLKLTRVKPSCGCTTPEWSREEIAPGEEGFIEVKFNSTGKSGVQSKAVTVTGNFEGTNQILRFRGEIKKPAAPAGAGSSNN